MDNYESECFPVTWDAVYCPYFTVQIITGKPSIAMLTGGLKYLTINFTVPVKHMQKHLCFQIPVR